MPPFVLACSSCWSGLALTNDLDLYRLVVIESIYNNRTAMVTYNKKIPSASSTEVGLWGTGAGIKANLQTWSLDAANNLGPQP